MAASMVGPTETPYPTREPVQRRSFQAAGLAWVFYSNGVDGVYRVSPDGLAWSEEALFKEGCGDGREFSTFFDGRYVHYVYAKRVVGEPSLYRRGEPKREGGIEWSAPEQLVMQETGSRYMVPNVSLDSEGYPWITCGRGGTYSFYSRIYKSSVKDGLWETDLEVTNPYSRSVSYGYTLPIPLRNGRLYFLTAYSYLYGALWDGEQWEDTEYISNLECRYSTAIGHNGDVHLVYRDDDNNITYRRRIAGIGWTGPISVFPTGVSIYPSLTLDPGTGDIYCLWIGVPIPNRLYYSRYDSRTGRWDDWPTEWMEIPLSANKYTLNTYSRVRNGRLGLVYRIGYEAPYEICFAALPFAPAVNPIWGLAPTAVGAVLLAAALPWGIGRS